MTVAFSSKVEAGSRDESTSHRKPGAVQQCDDKLSSSRLQIEGYVIISADGMLADASGVMPPALKFPGDQAFFESSLDAAALIVHGRNSYEDQPRSPQRRRIVLTRHVDGVATDPDNPRATLWNPVHTSFGDALAHSGVREGVIAVIGGPGVFAMFLDRYNTFWLSEAPRIKLPGGIGAFPGIPERSARDILSAHGLAAGEARMLDPADEVTVTPWRRMRS